MSVEITVIDYGLGNIWNVARIFERVGARVRVTDSPLDVEHAHCLVLPGVGAFANGMKGLREKGLSDAILMKARQGTPLLGICLGMQMLLDESDEFGRHRGLGLIPGRVRAIPRTTVDGSPHRIPHIGWNRLEVGQSWRESVLEGLSEPWVYFVHSFSAHPSDEAHLLANTNYNGHRLAAVICKDNVYGCQFHPERSGKIGFRIIENFLSLAQAACP